jgi:hypothetical protein
MERKGGAVTSRNFHSGALGKSKDPTGGNGGNREENEVMHGCGVFFEGFIYAGVVIGSLRRKLLREKVFLALKWVMHGGQIQGEGLNSGGRFA